MAWDAQQPMQQRAGRKVADVSKQSRNKGSTVDRLGARAWGCADLIEIRERERSGCHSYARMALKKGADFLYVNMVGRLNFRMSC